MGCGSCGGGGWRSPASRHSGAKVVDSADMQKSVRFAAAFGAAKPSGSSPAGAQMLKAPMRKAVIARRKI